MGSLFLQQNNVPLTKLNKNKVFIDKKGCIKIHDPDFIQEFGIESITEYEFIQSVVDIVNQLKNLEPSTEYSNKLNLLLEYMVNRFDKISELQMWIK